MAPKLQVVLPHRQISKYNSSVTQCCCYTPPNQACDLKLGSETCETRFEFPSVSDIRVGWSPCRLKPLYVRPYEVHEALTGYKRAAATHGWQVSRDSFLADVLMVNVLPRFQSALTNLFVRGITNLDLPRPSKYNMHNFTSPAYILSINICHYVPHFREDISRSGFKDRGIKPNQFCRYYKNRREKIIRIDNCNA